MAVILIRGTQVEQKAGSNPAVQGSSVGTSTHIAENYLKGKSNTPEGIAKGYGWRSGWRPAFLENGMVARQEV